MWNGSTVCECRPHFIIMEKTENQKQIEKDVIESSIAAYNELVVLLHPVMNDKIKHVNGKLLKDCFAHFKTILLAHQYVREHILELKDGDKIIKSKEQEKYERILQKGIRILKENPNQTTEILKVATKLTYLRGRLFEQTQRKKDKDDGSNDTLSGDTKQLRGQTNKEEQMPVSVDNHAENIPKNKRGLGRSYGY